MPANAWTVAQLADDTEREITGSHQRWTAFLTTAARLYKYPYREQLMIFAQRPEATACAEYDLWNKTMDWYKIFAGISGSLILIAVIILSYKIMLAGMNTSKKNDAKESIEEHYTL